MWFCCRSVVMARSSSTPVVVNLLPALAVDDGVPVAHDGVFAREKKGGKIWFE